MKFLLFSFFLSLPFDGFASDVKEDDASAASAASASRGGLVTINNPLLRLSIPLEVYNALKGEVPETIILNPLYQDRALRKGTPEERRLVNNRTNHPCFLDAAQSHGLNLDVIHQRGAAIRKFKTGGEDLASYLYTAQRMVALLQPIEGTVRKYALVGTNGEATIEAMLVELRANITRYSLALIPALRKISQMTGVSIEQLRFLPGIERSD